MVLISISICHIPNCGGLPEECYTHQIIYDNNKKGDICEKLEDLDILSDNILHCSCWKDSDGVEKTLNLTKWLCCQWIDFWLMSVFSLRFCGSRRVAKYLKIVLNINN